MTALTIDRPEGAYRSLAPQPAAKAVRHLHAVPRPAGHPGGVPAAREARVRAQARARAQMQARAQVQVRTGPGTRLHLTRRGRLIVGLAFVLAGVVAMVVLSGAFGPADAGTVPTRPATRSIVVQPGQTLWSIAGEVAPRADRRDTIARIVELNALPNSSVSAGERLAVPAP